MGNYFEEIIPIESLNEARVLFGTRDKNLKLIKQYFTSDIFIRKGDIHLRGDDEQDVEHVYQVVKHLLHKIKKHGSLSQHDLETILSGVGESAYPSGAAMFKSVEDDTAKQSLEGFKARTAGQSHYLEALQKNEITFVIGPAGTGKTYLAVAYGLHELRAGNFERLVLVRPAVEAGEKLGFLPGDLLDKVNPYLAPLFDSLHDFMEDAQVQRMMEAGVIEVVPLAYMRGRTLNKAFIIMDEAQNSTVAQMKMFLTRMGNRSNIVVTGDDTQIDLDPGEVSGLIHVQSILRESSTLSFVRLSTKDVVRHPLVQDIIKAYEEAEKNPFTRAQKRLSNDDPVLEV